MKPGSDTPRPCTAEAELELARLRHEIMRIDDALVQALAERVRLACAAAEFKREAGLPTLDPAREAAVVRRAADAARDQDLSADAVRGIFWQIIALCRGAQVGAD